MNSMSLINRRNALLAKSKKQNGFTLIELIIVVAVLGVIAAIVVPYANNVIERRSTARSIQAFSDNAQKSVRALLVSSGTSANVTTSPMIVAPNNFLDILVAGEDYVAAQYQRSYRDAGVATLDRSITVATAPTVGTAGAYTIRDYPVTISSPSIGVMNVVVSDVPTDVVERLKSDREGDTTFDPAVADTTGAIQYSVADANGNHTLTVQTTIN